MHRLQGVGVPYWWHRLVLADLVSQPLAQDVELRRANDGDIALYRQLAQPDVWRQSAEWLHAGNDLWLVVSRGSQLAFSCWVFRRRMPMGESRTGWLTMPHGVVFLEHSVTSADFRGRGIAPGAWSAIGAELRDEGLQVLFTKVTEENVATQRSLAKVGFTRADPDDPVVQQFASQLRRR